MIQDISIKTKLFIVLGIVYIGVIVLQLGTSRLAIDTLTYSREAQKNLRDLEQMIDTQSLVWQTSDAMQLAISGQRSLEQVRDISKAMISSLEKLIGANTFGAGQSYLRYIDLFSKDSDEYFAVLAEGDKDETQRYYYTTLAVLFSNLNSQLSGDIDEFQAKIEDINDQNNENISYSRGSITGIIVTSIFFGIVSIWMVSISVTKPLNQLGKALDDFAKGNLDARVVIKSNDEVGRLSLTFNKAVKHLKSNLEELEKSKRDLELIIKDRTKELNERLYESEKLNKALVGRELRMAELKEEFKRITKQR